VHGLGAAVDRAVNVALQLKVSSVGSVAPLEVSANTSTIDLIDDYIPVDDHHEAKTRSRHSSAVHIKVYRIGSDSGTTSDVTVCGKIPVDARTSDSLTPGVKSRKKLKKKSLSSEMQLS